MNRGEREVVCLSWKKNEIRGFLNEEFLYDTNFLIRKYSRRIFVRTVSKTPFILYSQCKEIIVQTECSIVKVISIGIFARSNVSQGRLFSNEILVESEAFAKGTLLQHPDSVVVAETNPALSMSLPIASGCYCKILFAKTSESTKVSSENNCSREILERANS